MSTASGSAGVPPARVRFGIRAGGRPALLGITLAGLVALVACRRGSLSLSGAIAATAVGAVAFSHGKQATAELLTFFITSTLLSHRGRGRESDKPRRTATQVLANGGLATLVWCMGISMASRRQSSIASGALAAAAADTWATEIGQRWGGAPRLITNGRPVARGASGGVTSLGLLASAGGALAVGLVSRSPAGVARALLSGVAGSLVDSLLGATLQARYRCPTCGQVSEHASHCGARGHLARGLAWMTNDTVNALATVVGGLAAGVAWHWQATEQKGQDAAGGVSRPRIHKHRR